MKRSKGQLSVSSTVSWDRVGAARLKYNFTVIHQLKFGMNISPDNKPNHINSELIPQKQQQFRINSAKTTIKPL
jgi:hypothetical protein